MSDPDYDIVKNLRGNDSPLKWDAADEIERLRARIAELEDECNDRHDMLVEARARETSLQSQVAGLIEDKRRLDWLADTDNTNGTVQLPRNCVIENVGSMRDAIDAAMALPADEQD